MSPLANAHWRPAPDTRSGLRLAATSAALVIGGLIIASYLAGYFFLWSFHLDPKRATPLTIVQYRYYYATNPPVRHRLELCSAAGLILVLASSAAVLIPRRRPLHGDARFARRVEIARAGLLGDQGIILGKLSSRYLMLPGQQSVILAAPPRSGKDVGVVIPNGLNWPGSLMQVDIKRESWSLTSGYRASCGQACYRFEPLEPHGDTARTNPLTYVSKSPDKRIDGIQRIADILYVETPGTDPFWIASARNLFLGICLYLFETPSLLKTLGEVRRQGMATDDEGFGAHWKRIVQGRQSGTNPLSAECVRALYDVIDLAPVTASSVRKTFTSRLELWANPLLDAATSGDDFDLRDLRRKPISIYVCVDPDDLHRMRPVLSLLFQQAIGLQTKELPEHNPDLKYPLLFLLNEFTALGRINVIAESMAYMPGYNLRILMVIQAPSQLREVYGPYAAETMMKSVAARIVFAPKDYADAKEISDELGFTTVLVRSDSRPSFMAFNRQSGRHRSSTYSQQARALLLPQEVKEMGNDQALILYEGVRPIRCRKIRYYNDRHFRKRLLPPSEHATPGASTTLQRFVRPASASLKQTGVPQPIAPASVPAPPPISVKEPAVDDALNEPLNDPSNDIELLEAITLEDVDGAVRDLTFEHQGERPTDSEIEADVKQFLEVLQR